MTDTSRADAFLDGSLAELFLSQGEWGITCRAYRESDDTTREYDIDSLSMRGAQREMTSYLVAHGYTAVGRWATESDNAEGLETSRKFRSGGGESGVSTAH
jgi:hypothetical protein